MRVAMGLAQRREMLAVDSTAVFVAVVNAGSPAGGIAPAATLALGRDRLRAAHPAPPSLDTRGPRVVGVLRSAVESGAEGLLHRALGIAEGARQLAQHRVRDHHRGQLASGEHVAPDRDRLVGEVLDHPLVEALVAAAEKRDVALLGELGREALVEQPARGSEGDLPDPIAGGSVGGAASTTSTRITIPAPPPYGASSTCPALSGVVSR